MVMRVPIIIPWFLSLANIAMQQSEAEAVIVVAAFNVGIVAISTVDFMILRYSLLQVR